MKKIIILITVVILLITLPSCSSNNTVTEKKICAICGAEATSGVSGSAYMLEQMGVDLSK